MHVFISYKKTFFLRKFSLNGGLKVMVGYPAECGNLDALK